MALSLEQYKALRRSGMSAADIDSMEAAGATPEAAGPAPSGERPSLASGLAGMGASALDAVGGLRGVATVGGLAAGGFGGAKLAKRIFGGRPSAPPDATGGGPGGGPPRPSRGLLERVPARVPGASVPAAAPAEKLPASLVRLTEADVRDIPEFQRFQPGETVRRATYEKAKMGDGRPMAGEGQTGVKGYVRKKPTARERRNARVVAEKPSNVVEMPARPSAPVAEAAGAGGPVRQSSATVNAPGKVIVPQTGGEGASGPELRRRYADMIRARSRPGGPGGLNPRWPRPAGWEGSTEQAALARTLGRAAPGLGALMFLLDAASLPGQIDDAQRVVQRAFMKQRGLSEEQIDDMLSYPEGI